MTADSSPTPPRLGLALLERVGNRNEALAGDLVEGFQLARSRLWFWRQLLWAIVTGGFRRPVEIRPLRLVESPSWQPAAPDFVASRQVLQTRRLAASPVGGIGGLGIAAIILLAVLVRPSAFTIVAAGAVLGIPLGAARIVFGRRPANTPAGPILLDASSPESRRPS